MQATILEEFIMGRRRWIAKDEAGGSWFLVLGSWFSVFSFQYSVFSFQFSVFSFQFSIWRLGLQAVAFIKVPWGIMHHLFGQSFQEFAAQDFPFDG